MTACLGNPLITLEVYSFPRFTGMSLILEVLYLSMSSVTLTLFTSFSICQNENEYSDSQSLEKKSLNRSDKKEIAFLLNQRLFIQTMGHAESCLAC